MLPLANQHVLDLVPYIPGRPVKQTKDQFGVSDLVKLASNENPFGPSPKAIVAAQLAMNEAHFYPISDRFTLKEKISEKLSQYGVSPKNIVLGNGANELITLLVRSLIGSGESLLNAWPSFVVFRLAAAAQGRLEIAVPLTKELDYDLGRMLEVAAAEKNNPVKMVFIATPNNPTGKYISIDDLRRFSKELSEEIVLVFDEAYFDYVEKSDHDTAMSLVFERPRTVVLRTFSKIFGLAGLRIGYAICDQEIAEILHRIRDPFNVNGVAQAAALAALGDQEHIDKSRISNNSELPRVSSEMRNLGFATTKSAANFVLMHLGENMPSIDVVADGLIKCGVIIRPLKNYGLMRAARVTIGTPKENDKLLDGLLSISKANA